MKRNTLVSALCLLAVFLVTSVVVADPPVINNVTVQKIYNAQEDVYDYIYSLDYQHNYGHDGPIFDWHVWLGNWTPGQITITPPENWTGQWQGGTYGCETNQYPFVFGNMYIGAWKITVKPGYGDGTTTWYFTDSLHNVVAQQSLLTPMVPEPASILALAGGLGCLLPLVRRRK